MFQCQAGGIGSRRAVKAEALRLSGRACADDLAVELQGSATTVEVDCEWSPHKRQTVWTNAALSLGIFDI